MGRQHQGLDRPAVQQVPEGSGEHRKMEKTGCKIICGAPTTLSVKELMIMMMTMTRAPSAVIKAVVLELRYASTPRLIILSLLEGCLRL